MSLPLRIPGDGLLDEDFVSLGFCWLQHQLDQLWSYAAQWLASLGECAESCFEARKGYVLMQVVEQMTERQLPKLSDLEIIVSTMLGNRDFNQRLDSLLAEVNDRIAVFRSTVLDNVRREFSDALAQLKGRISQLPQLAEFQSQVERLIAALPAHQKDVETRVGSIFRDGAAAQQAFLEEAVLRVQRCVVDPSLATVEKWAALPLSTLWGDCRMLIDKHAASANNFVSSTREGVVMEVHVLLENVSTDIIALRGSATFVQKCKAEFSQSAMLRDAVQDPSTKVSIHEVAIQKLTALIGEVAAHSPSTVVDAASSEFNLFLDSVALASQVRQVLGQIHPGAPVLPPRAKHVEQKRYNTSLTPARSRPGGPMPQQGQSTIGAARLHARLHARRRN
ncbi:unnamed protein product [Prorocentrum cordatum]|uniref:Uncharacterized protein n=1 Tax=Prorocentrum cordatum TaxID=2364126 RepID=A0ABN9V5D4_9DINO|nr:unnamed protein product [Polarella glacialis]